MKVAVIGAGGGGLTAVKTCLDEGLHPTCFEQKSGLGGVWNYLEVPVEGHPSCIKSTYSNTTKESYCFSDFPYPEDFPNFLHHTKIIEYFKMYAKRFDLDKHIQYCTKVIEVQQTDDFQKTGRWIVKTKNTVSGDSSSEIFDAVLVCNGHHGIPVMPQLDGTSRFKGKLIHCNEYRNLSEFENKRVVVVGFANTAGDIAVELTHVCSQVFMSTGRGGWIFPRIVNGGVTLGYALRNRAVNALPLFIKRFILEYMLSRVLDHSMYGIKPKHSADMQQPMINDALPALLAANRIIVRRKIKSLTETGVIFDDGSFEDNIDTIIYATGYKLDMSFLKHPSYKVNEKNEVDLYKFVFAPDVKPHTLAIIGIIQPFNSFFPILELQSRWAVAVFKGEKSLPSMENMRKEIEKRRREILRQYVDCPRYSTNVDWIIYMDEIADEIGCKPRSGLLLLTDPRLALAVIFGECIPSHYRLRGKGAWPGARETILNSWNRMLKPLKKTDFTNYKKRKALPWFLAFAILAVAGAIALYAHKESLIQFDWKSSITW